MDLQKRQSSGIMVVGGQEHQAAKGAVIVTPPDTAHFTIPRENLVLAVINTPSFKPENAIFLTEGNPGVGFDLEQFEKLKP